MGEIETKVILRIGHEKLLVRLPAATKIMEGLIEENLQRVHDDYNKNAEGVYGYIKKITGMGSEDVCIQYMPHAEYLIRCANGDKDAS